ncbi:MAG: hypothetical protein KDJ47_03240 [Hyphomicrobiaceae bacterium]|nr:hypothetical protein [Hyphomicrobiaceae bacterium]
MFARLKNWTASFLRPKGPKTVTVPGTEQVVLGQQAVRAPYTKADYSDKRTKTFVWPADQLEHPEQATAVGFARWLREHDKSNLPRQILVDLWWDYVVGHDLRPLPWHEFDRSLKRAGIVRYRSSLPSRPWLYRVEELPSAEVIRLDRGAA